jgi:hypothetical protein
MRPRSADFFRKIYRNAAKVAKGRREKWINVNSSSSLLEVEHLNLIRTPFF